MMKTGEKVMVTIDGVQKEIVIQSNEEMKEKRKRMMQEYEEAEEMSHMAMKALNQMDTENMTPEEIDKAMTPYYQKQA